MWNLDVQQHAVSSGINKQRDFFHYRYGNVLPLSMYFRRSRMPKPLEYTPTGSGISSTMS